MNIFTKKDSPITTAMELHERIEELVENFNKHSPREEEAAIIGIFKRKQLTLGSEVGILQYMHAKGGFIINGLLQLMRGWRKEHPDLYESFIGGLEELGKSPPSPFSPSSNLSDLLSSLLETDLECPCGCDKKLPKSAADVFRKENPRGFGGN